MEKYIVECPKCAKVKRFGEFVRIDNRMRRAITNQKYKSIYEVCPACG